MPRFVESCVINPAGLNCTPPQHEKWVIIVETFSTSEVANAFFFFFTSYTCFGKHTQNYYIKGFLISTLLLLQIQKQL